jgi:hypothetical protein
MLKIFMEIPSSLRKGPPFKSGLRAGYRFAVEVPSALEVNRPGDEGVGEK